jgi:hypothetical protein
VTEALSKRHLGILRLSAVTGALSKRHLERLRLSAVTVRHSQSDISNY